MEYFTYGYLGIMWIYSTICLFAIAMNGGSVYWKMTPQLDHTHYTAYYIPLFWITSYYDKKYVNLDYQTIHSPPIKN